MTQNTIAREPVFVSGRRNRLFCLRVELKEFSSFIRANMGHTEDTKDILNAMDALVGAIDDAQAAGIA